MTVLYNNDEYKYAWDKLTQNFYVINPDNQVIYRKFVNLRFAVDYKNYGGFNNDGITKSSNRTAARGT